MKPPEYPGDQDPQTTNIELSDNQFRFQVGATLIKFNPFIIYANYSICKFNILTIGAQFRF